MRRLLASAVLLLPLLLLAGCQKELVCPEGRTACGDRCVSLLSDAANCGSCGAAVGPLEVCAAGAPACASDVGVCGAACTDLARDPANCGACGNACPGPQLCATASCVDACSPGQTACGRSCVDVDSDRFHCGGCGIACAPGEGCHEGTCRSDIYVACNATNEIVPVAADLEPAGASRSTPAGPQALAVAGASVFSANGYPSASVSVLPLASSSAPLHVPVAGSDLQHVARHGDVVLVTNASVGSLLVLDLSGQVVGEIAMPDQQSAPNPHGVAAAGDTAWVALFGYGPGSGQSIAKVDLSGLSACVAAPGTAPCGAVLDEIDLLAVTGAFDPPGLPFPSSVVTTAGRAFVTLANLEEDATPWGTGYVKPAGNGKLAMIDAEAGDAVTIVELPGCGNPGAIALAGTTAWIACGTYSDDYVSLAPRVLLPVNVGVSPPAPGTPLPLPGVVPGKVRFCAGMGYVTDQKTGSVLRFSPATRAVEAPVTICPSSPGPFGYAWAADVACPE